MLKYGDEAKSGDYAHVREYNRANALRMSVCMITFFVQVFFFFFFQRRNLVICVAFLFDGDVLVFSNVVIL